MKPTKPPSALEDARATIRRTGLRGTAARIAVLQRLQQATAPLSHADMADDLVSQGFDRATIYRNLMDLTEVGLLVRTDLGDHIWRFELRRDVEKQAREHPHFMCIACGSVVCLLKVDVRIPPEPDLAQSGVGEVSEVMLKGRCRRCA